MKAEHLTHFAITVAAILVGLVVGKKVSQGLATAGVPISSNDPLIIPIPATAAPVVPSPTATPTSQQQVGRQGDA